MYKIVERAGSLEDGEQTLHSTRDVHFSLLFLLWVGGRGEEEVTARACQTRVVHWQPADCLASADRFPFLSEGSQHPPV